MDNETFIDKIFRLAKEDPAQLEQILLNEIERIYEGTSPEELAKLKGAQFRMDLIRQRWGNNHTQAYIAMGQEMMPKFNALNSELQIQKRHIDETRAKLQQLLNPELVASKAESETHNETKVSTPRFRVVK